MRPPPDKRRRPARQPGAPKVSPRRSTTAILPDGADVWGECAGGCGPALLVQGSRWCWPCTYGDGRAP